MTPIRQQYNERSDLEQPLHVHVLSLVRAAWTGQSDGRFHDACSSRGTSGDSTLPQDYARTDRRDRYTLKAGNCHMCGDRIALGRRANLRRGPMARGADAQPISRYAGRFAETTRRSSCCRAGPRTRSVARSLSSRSGRVGGPWSKISVQILDGNALKPQGLLTLHAADGRKARISRRPQSSAAPTGWRHFVALRTHGEQPCKIMRSYFCWHPIQMRQGSRPNDYLKRPGNNSARASKLRRHLARGSDRPSSDASPRATSTS